MDYTAMFGSRISNLEINPRVEGEWAPIDLVQTYTVVTNSFIASGRDGYYTFVSDGVVGSYIDTFLEYGQSFVNYVREVQTLVDLPLSEYSTQSIKMSDTTTYSLPTASPTDSPTESPTDKSAGDGKKGKEKKGKKEKEEKRKGEKIKVKKDASM
jgi:5'-nucleotidase/UDP-sugar diphosphatase